MSADEIVWEDPPPPTVSRGNGSNLRKIAALQEHPGKWARFEGFATPNRAGSHASALKKLGAEARSHSDVKASKFFVYARWPEDAS